MARHYLWLRVGFRVLVLRVCERQRVVRERGWWDRVCETATEGGWGRVRGSKGLCLLSRAKEKNGNRQFYPKKPVGDRFVSSFYPKKFRYDIAVFIFFMNPPHTNMNPHQANMNPPLQKWILTKTNESAIKKHESAMTFCAGFIFYNGGFICYKGGFILAWYGFINFKWQKCWK